MAKKVRAVVTLQLPAGKANPAPPVGPALGQHGVNIMEFCKDYNARTQDKVGQIIPVHHAGDGDAVFRAIVHPNDVQDQGTEAPAAAADSDLMQQLATLSSQADKGKAAFDALYPSAADHVRAAAGSAVSSEAWVVAHVDLSALEQARYDSVYAFASLDTLYAERAKALAEGKVQGGARAVRARVER